MGLYSNFPYTNFHEMNLDWILKELKELVDEWDSFGGNVTSEAHVSSIPEVSVSGNLKTGLNFNFGLVEGPRGQAGPEGPAGPEGKGLEILGVYATLSQLQTAHPTGTAGDIYLVGSDNNYIMYVWSEDQNAWLEGGALTSPSPSTAAPLMNGVASAGTLTSYSRADHIHPSDTSKQDLLVSGTNIKTVNGYSVLGNGDIPFKTVNEQAITGSGDIEVQEPLVSGTNIKTVNSNSLLGQGDIAVQEPLVSGTNIKTVNSNSLLGQGDIAVQEPLVSGTNIKTVNNQSILGQGNINIQASGLTFDTVWTNEAPTSAFSSQTLSLDLSTYNFIIIEYNLAVTDPNIKNSEIAMINGSTIRLAGYNPKIVFRNATVTDTGITFTQAEDYTSYGGSPANSVNQIIPTAVYGIK